METRRCGPPSWPLDIISASLSASGRINPPDIEVRYE
jgi:hypothetical protein